MFNFSFQPWSSDECVSVANIPVKLENPDTLIGFQSRIVMLKTDKVFAKLFL